MPEGDTLRRVADRLAPALVEHELTRFEARRLVGLRPRLGERILGVEAVGKWLVIEFSGGLSLTTHLKMTGSWHLVGGGSRWPKPAHLARAVVGVEGWTALCVQAPIVRTFPTSAPRHEKPFGHLGPDLCRDSPDLEAAADAWGRFAVDGISVAEILLDQRVACGVGNVYRAEVLWASGLHPWTPADGFTRAHRIEVLGIAHRLLRANLGSGPRVTHRGGLGVYGRERQGCARCGGRVEVTATGEHARRVWWCPRCQARPSTRSTAISMQRRSGRSFGSE